ncbi:MAG TPA: 6-carboxytetrahydropterin synthase QueD [Candidatus Cloacimonadota bacterium]|nr:6-carboxytetrahydropterin synthase QueD [Candidatus Cloacimonadota bacterium]HPT70956.1 6-carboxytetrahydropterin synthase QueD [Candidatus Cloacimonadota bacterium]
MYKINVTDSFSAAHQLKGYNGECKNLHGHTWKVRVGITCNTTDEIGLSLDFNVVKKHLKELMEILDHKCLNDLAEFKVMNPTSENLSRFMYLWLKERITMPDCSLAEVEVWESEKSSIVYSE